MTGISGRRSSGASIGLAGRKRVRIGRLNPNTERNPKAEGRKLKTVRSPAGFGFVPFPAFRICFGFRISAFEFESFRNRALDETCPKRLSCGA
jgi:hypothetical protein